jgi:neutral ceramidase
MAFPLRCGAASMVITPPLGTSLEGYFTDRKASGVLDDLYASALVLEKGGGKIVLVACDLIGWPDGLARTIREEITEKLGTVPDCVILTATHTHTGPVMNGELADPTYLDWLAGKVVAAALVADNHLVPGALEYGAGMNERYAFNRRYFMKNGTVLTNPGANNPDVVRPAGSADHSMQVIKVVDDQNQVQAVVVNYANHPDTTGGTLISADWPGHLRSTVQSHLARKVPVLVLNGAAGDINHFDVMNNHVVKSPEESRTIGASYGQTACQILDHAQPLQVDGLAGVSEIIPVPYRHITAAEWDAALRTVAELADDPEAVLQGDLDAQDIARGSKAVRLMFAQNIVRAVQEMQGKFLPLEITVLRLGSLGLVGINGEVFSEIGISIKQSSPFAHTLVAELANGYIGYLGTKKAYRQGGYETLLGERASDEVEDFILNGVAKATHRLFI